MQSSNPFTTARQAQLDRFVDMTNAIAENVEKLTLLNLKTLRETMSQAFDHARLTLSVKEPREWLALEDSRVTPAAERMRQYNGELLDILSAMQAELARFQRVQWDAYSNGTQTLLDGLAKNGPAGSQAAMSALNSAIAATDTLYATLQKTGEQAIEATRSGIDLVAAATAKSVQRSRAQITQAAQGATKR